MSVQCHRKTYVLKDGKLVAAQVQAPIQRLQGLRYVNVILEDFPDRY